MVEELGVGGAEGSRTPDLQSAILALSQLSYGPNASGCMVRPTGQVKRAPLA